MHVWWIWPTVLVENQPSGLLPVEETNQVIKMLSNYSTAAVTLLLALGVDKAYSWAIQKSKMIHINNNVLFLYFVVVTLT
jgi:hypothetical protein